MSINWSHIDNQSLLGRCLRFPLRFIPRESMVRIRRGPAKGMKWIVGSSNHGCWLGTYELEKQLALQKAVRKGMVVYDIGAQAGFYTLFFSRVVGEDGKVYAVEPLAENLRYLLAHIQLNELRNVEVIAAALCEKSGLENFSIDRERSQNRLVASGKSILRVPTLSLDDLIEGQGCAPPNLIKMDVEGAEVRILQGARTTLDRSRPILFIALHGEEQRRACWEILKDTDYRVCDIEGRELSDWAVTDEVCAWLPTGLRHECVSSDAGK